MYKQQCINDGPHTNHEQKVTDFTKTWKDGKAIVAIAHRKKPSSIDLKVTAIPNICIVIVLYCLLISIVKGFDGECNSGGTMDRCVCRSRKSWRSALGKSDFFLSRFFSFYFSVFHFLLFFSSQFFTFYFHLLFIYTFLYIYRWTLRILWMFLFLKGLV